jgi:hypothetical protein
MLVTKTFCKPGSLIYIVPTGLLVTLWYDPHGQLHKIFKGFTSYDDTDAAEELPDDFKSAVVKNGLIPGSIKITGGASAVWGVFYSDEFKTSVGNVPDCEFDRIINDITTGNIKYKFYIGNIDSGAAAINNPTSLNTHARMSGFEILPTWLIPTEATDKTLKDYITSNIHYPFKYPLISGYVVYEGVSKPYFYSLNLHTITVKDTLKYVNHSGYIKYKVQYGTDETLYMNYPDAAFFNVKKNSQLVLDGETVIWSNTKSSNHSDRLPKRLVCKSCGKILDVPDAGLMTCTNPYCTSLLYPRIERFCKVLGLDVLSKEQFDKYISKSDLQIFPDLLLLPEYKDVKIKKNLWEIIFACLPMEVGTDKQWLIKFCNRCNNNYQTVKFYFDSPVRIYTELDMNVSRRLANWLSEPRNIVELDTVINSDQIDIPVKDKIMSFDGAPIFRNKTFFITGTFRHGSLAEIQAILESYSAIVVTDYDDYIQGVLVGDIKDGIDGHAINAARELNLPVYNESEFFAKYEIDADLEKYLL